MTKANSNGPVAAEELRLLIQRIERLEEEKAGIADDIKGVFGEAKARGFCTKTMKKIVSLRKLTPDERRQAEAMLDLYRGALGMLDGTPLGRWATEKTAPPEERPASEEEAAAGSQGAEGEAAPEAEPGPPPPPPITVEDARRMGREAAEAGQAVTSNPFPARDPRRAAWDEAWCQNMGSDGMDIPEALRPAPKKKADPTSRPNQGETEGKGEGEAE